MNLLWLITYFACRVNHGGFKVDGLPGEQMGTFYNGLRGYERNNRYLQQRSGSNSPNRTNGSKMNPFTKDYLVDGQNTYSSGMAQQ